MPPFYLETWVNQIAGTVLGTDCVSRAEVRAYQLARLQQTLRYCYRKSSFYRELYDSAGIHPDGIRTIEDLSRLPFTDPVHLADNPYRFLCMSQAEIARPYTFITSGTTGLQKKVFWSRGDLERIIEFMAAGIASVAETGDVVQIMLVDGRPYSQADLLFQGVQKIGSTPVLAGMDLSPEECLKIIESAHSTVLFGYTNRLFRMTKALEGEHDLTRSGVKALFAAGEYMPDAIRRQLQDAWDCAVYTHYGLTEMGLGVAIECAAHDGYHFNEAGLILEVVDPETGENVPAGEEGELVFTTLAREAMPLIRYRTHDISRQIPEPCPCGASTLLRIDAVKKRRESIVQLSGGTGIYPSLLDDVLFEVPGLIDYQAVLVRRNGEDRLDISAEVYPPYPDAADAIREKLQSLSPISESIRSGRMARPSVTLSEIGSLKSTGSAKKRLVVNGNLFQL